MSAVVIRGDAAHLPLPDRSVDLICTSPPYFGLRSYTDGGTHYEGQIGAEYTPQEYVAALLDCTREWMRVLKPGGSIFVNLGDKYSTYTGANWGNGRSLDGFRGQRKVPNGGPVSAPSVYGIPYKSLMMLPQRYAIGCIDNLGLTLRAEIIWDKPNGMPESATDRVRRSHEQVFHFVKEPRRYFSGVDEIREPHAEWTSKAYEYERRGYARRVNADRADEGGFKKAPEINALGKLPGSVWEITPVPLKVPDWLDVDHFAAYPPELCRRIILGWSPSGICTECGDGRRPVASSVRTLDGQSRDDLPAWADPGAPRRTPNGGIGHRRYATDRRLTGYACTCPSPVAPTRPAVVADPFGGTGTTALVADALGRAGITVDRSADYCRLARWRTTDPGERARALGVPKPPPVPENQGSLFDDLKEEAS